MSGIIVSGDTSGSVTLSAPAVAGTVTVTLPSTSGTMAVTGGSPSFTNITATGNLTFTGTGNRITGDFSNATVTNNVAFQTSTVNGNTDVIALPNGTNTGSSFFGYNNSNPTNASYIRLWQRLNSSQIESGITGTGTYVPMTFYTGGTESLRLSPTTKAVILAGGSTSADGTGITFPATQSASTDVNTLDDYEEGGWTPSVGGTATYTSQSGSYIKIGRQVTVWFDLQINVIGTGSAQLIAGLPFSGSGSGQGGSPTFWQTLTVAPVYVGMRVDGGSSQIQLSGATAATANLTSTFNCLGSSSRLIGTLTYAASS